MPDNPYYPESDGVNPYLPLANDLRVEENNNLSRSFFGASDQSPEEKARAIDLSQRLDISKDLIESDPKSFEDYDYKKQAENLLQYAPKTADWLKNPDHAALTKDDLENTSSIESKVNEYSIVDKSLRTLNSGSAAILSGLARLPALANDIGLFPINVVRQYFLDKPELRTPDWLLDNPISTHFDEVAKNYTIPEVGGRVIKEFSEGNFSKTGEILYYKTLQNAPNLGLLLVTGGAFGAARAAVGAGVLASAQQEAVAQKAPGVSQMAATVNAVANGVYEAAFEELGTLSVFAKTTKKVAKKYGTQVAKEMVQGFAKAIAKSAAVEGGEEFATQIAQDLNDYVTGVNPDALKTLISNGIESFLVGASSGAVISGPSAVATGVVQGQQVQKANLNRDFYLSLGNSVEATKLRERLPSKLKELVDHITQDTAVKNIYISPEAIDTYFQSKDINPTEAAQALGILKEYSEAKDSGSDMAVPLSTWTSQVVGTEHYAPLANDVKFQPEDLSVNEAKKYKEELQKAAEEAKPASEDIQGQEIRKNIQSQLESAGINSKDAKLYSEVLRGFENISDRAGVSPEELFNRFGLKINGPQVENEKILNQSAVTEDPFLKFSQSEQGLQAAIEHPLSEGGRYINQDTYRELHPEYAASKENKSIYIEATQAGSEILTQRMFDRALNQPVLGDASFIIGGPGSGKTTAGKSTLKTLSKVSDFVMDAVGADYEKLKSNIERSLATERDVYVAFIFTPYEQALLNIIERAKAEGRQVPPYVAARGHVRSIESYLKLNEDFGSNERVHLVAATPDFEQKGGLPKVVPLSEIQKLRYIGANETEAQAIDRLQKLAEARFVGTAAEVKSGVGSNASEPNASPTGGRTLFQNALTEQIAPSLTITDPLGYYSKLQADIAAMDFASIPANDLIGRIKNLPGVKSEELEWTGVNDWLANQGGKVSKEEVQNFLQENGVQIKQTVLGAEAGTSKDITWGEPRQLSLDEIDPYGDLVKEETGYYLEESDMADWWTKEIKAENPDISEEDLKQELRDRAEKAAIESLEDENSPYARFRIDANENNWFIEGSDESGWSIYNPETRNWTHDIRDLEEAKIQAIVKMQDHDVLPSELRKTKESEIKWGNNKPEFLYPKEVTLAKYFKENSKRFIDEQKKENWYDGDGKLLPKNDRFLNLKEIRNYARSASDAEYVSRYSDISNPKNFFRVKTDNPFFKLEIYGSSEKGFTLYVKDAPELMTEIQAKTIESAKVKAIEYLKEKGFVGEPSKSEINNPIGPSKFERWSLKGGTNYREILLSEPKKIKGRFEGGHFNEPNVIAHIRTKDRVSPDGKKGLFIEEIQSDLHQQAREKGYRSESDSKLNDLRMASDKAASVKKEAANILNNELVMNDNLGFDGTYQAMNSIEDAGNIEAWIGQFQDIKSQTPLYDAIKNYYTAIKENESAYQAYAYYDWLDLVPNAPFKNTEAWAMLAFKRILSMAAQDGYDFVSWAPGQVHADRYNMSEHVGEIAYTKDGDAYVVQVTNTSGDEINLPQPSYKANELPQVFGKEISQKIIEESKSSPNGKIAGAGLELGGEGHKYFYDKMLPKIVQKYIGKLDKNIKVDIESGKKLFGEPLKERNKEFDKFWTIRLSDEFKNKILQGQTLFQKSEDGPRGQLRVGPNKTLSIDLLKNMDRSTFLHEMGHVYLEVLSEASLLPEAQESLKSDLQVIRDWVGSKEGEKFTVEQHEKFARGFEAYLMEGKAPSSALRKAFAAFKVWLTNIYKTIRSLNVELTDDVRGVFDRILAAESEINQAELEQNRSFLGKDPMLHGMNEEQSARYLKAVKEAEDMAKADLQAKLMKDLTRKQTKEYKARKEAITEEVTYQVENSQTYKSIERLQSNESIEGAQPLKLDRSAIDPEIAKKMPRGVFSKEDGIHPSIVAEALGYESAPAMLEDLSTAMPKKDAIETIINQRIEAEFPELLNSPQLSEEAMESIHLEQRAKVLRMQLEHLASENLPALKEVAKGLIRRLPSDSKVKAQALEILGNKNIKDTKPYLYQRAEKNQAKEAAKLFSQGDIVGAFEAKRKEYLNFELYRAAVEAQSQIDKGFKNFKKLFKSDEDLAKNRDISLVKAARAVLAQAGLAQSDRTAEDYIKSLRQYDPEQYEAVKLLIEAVQSKPYQSMTLNEFTDLQVAVQTLWNLSKENKRMEIDGKKIQTEQVVSELSEVLSKLTPKEISKYKKSKDGWDKTKSHLLSAASMLRRVEAWADATGPAFTKYIFQPVSEAASQYRIQNEKIQKEFLKIIEPIKSDLIPKPVVSDELGYEFSGLSEILGALLHTGNQSNFSKLLRGRGWGEVDADGILDTRKWDKFINRMMNEGVLKKEHFDALQRVWDITESLKAGAQKAHQQLYGYHFAEITADAFTNRFGSYRGGYVPAIVDPDASSSQAIRIEKNIIEENDNAYMFPTTGKGFTKSRVEHFAEPLTMNLKFIPQHLDKVLRFTHIQPRVKDVAKLLWNRQMQQAMDAFDPSVRGEMLVPWLQRSAQQMVDIPSSTKAGKAMDRFSKYLRKQSGIQTMVANVVNTLQNFTGFSVAATKVSPKHLRNSLWQYMKSPSSVSDSVNEKSDFMKTRTSTQLFDISKRVDDILLNPTKFEKVKEFAVEHGYILQRLSQNMIDHIVWMGAYDEAVSKGLTETEAIRKADAAVRLTQGSFNPEDISRIETGAPWVRLFTQFASYFNMLANLLATEFIKIARDMGLKKGAGRGLYIYALGFMIPAMVSDLIVRSMSGHFDEDDDDSYLNDIIESFFLSQVKTGMAMLPVVGSVINTGINQFNKKAYDDRITTSPAISLIESSVRAPKSVYEAIINDGNQKKAIRDSLTLLGLLSGLPVAPLGKPLGYLSDVSQGEVDPENVFDFTRGLVTGRKGQ